MREETKTVLKGAILATLAVFRDLCPEYPELHLCWTKTEDGRWQGQYQQRPSLRRVFMAAEKQLRDASAEFSKCFLSDYPEYAGGKMVGISGLVGERIGHQPERIVERAVGYLWKRFERLDYSELEVDAVVNEFKEFLEEPTIHVRFQAQILNFHMPAEVLELPDGLVIKRLSEREITFFQGGAVMGDMRGSWSFQIHEFAIEGDFSGAKVFPEQCTDVAPVQETTRAKLDKVLLCLRTFKDGIVGYDLVRFRFIKFCPLVLPAYESFERQARPGIYSLSAEEMPTLLQHAQMIFGLSDSALESACVRLADAESRSRAQDQVLDAVIGMESLLLAGLDKADRRSELKYRFAMNYSTLSNLPEERWRAYNVAKDLYDHRSTIAHGGNVANKLLRVGNEKMKLPDVSKCAREALRKLIKHFLPYAGTAPYKKAKFWEQAYFGIPDRGSPEL